MGRREDTDTSRRCSVKMEAEIRVMCPQTKGSEGVPADTRSRKRQGRIPSKSLQKQCSPANALILVL